MMSQWKKQTFQKKIFQWWKVNKRDLPWRHTHDPYKILVSEVMLQQTTVSRVLTKYPVFIKAYPTEGSCECFFRRYSANLERDGV
ncbi:MAG: A/G-specific adenine glycosylase [Microgenomates group bacterium GW2011_GWB1_40_9]|nr:MAG: A/G-specific adenine glycosylase [Microgenomates group bacterium GW2011_GWB1_40_9]